MRPCFGVARSSLSPGGAAPFAFWPLRGLMPAGPLRGLPGPPPAGRAARAASRARSGVCALASLAGPAPLRSPPAPSLGPLCALASLRARGALAAPAAPPPHPLRCGLPPLALWLPLLCSGSALGFAWAAGSPPLGPLRGFGAAASSPGGRQPQAAALMASPPGSLRPSAAARSVRCCAWPGPVASAAVIGGFPPAPPPAPPPPPGAPGGPRPVGWVSAFCRVSLGAAMPLGLRPARPSGAVHFP